MSILRDGKSPVPTGKTVRREQDGSIAVVRQDIDSRDAKRAKLEAAQKAIRDEIRQMDREANDEALDAVTKSVCLHYEKLTNRVVLNDETEYKRVRELSAKILGFAARHRSRGESDGLTEVSRNIAKVIGDL